MDYSSRQQSTTSPDICLTYTDHSDNYKKRSKKPSRLKNLFKKYPYPEESDDSEAIGTPPLGKSYYGTFWIDKHDGNMLNRKKCEQPSKGQAQQILEAATDGVALVGLSALASVAPEDAKEKWETRGGFYYRDANARDELEKDYYWDDNDMDRRDELKEEFYKMKEQRDERGKDFGMFTATVAAVSTGLMK